MAFRRMETSLGPGQGLGIEATVKGPPFWTAWYCVAVAVAIVARLLRVEGVGLIDVLAIRRQVLRFDISSNFAIPRENLVQVAKRMREPMAKVSTRCDYTTCRATRNCVIVIFCISLRQLGDRRCSNHAPGATSSNAFSEIGDVQTTLQER